MTSPARSPQLAHLAGLLADRTRAAFCLALLDGRAWTAGELAAHARVAPSTASQHLGRLVAGGLLTERRQGRHRYLQLADGQAADLVETIVAHLEPPAEPPRTLRAATASAALARGRTCYDHLAGRLGVAIADAMTRNGLLDQTRGFALTTDGITWLRAELRIDPDALRSTRRPLARACLDWTERRTHLAGTAGAHLCRHFHHHHWITRIGTSRAVRVTPRGQAALHQLLNITHTELVVPERGNTGT